MSQNQNAFAGSGERPDLTSPTLKSSLDRLLASYEDAACKHTRAPGHIRPPQMYEVRRVVTGLLSLLFPGYRGPNVTNPDFQSHVMMRARALHKRLVCLASRARAFHEATLSQPPLSRTVLRQETERLIVSFIDELPNIRRILDADVQAAHENDPALPKHDHNLVPLAYPGIVAIAVYRMAHALHLLGIPYLPREMTELAHRWTGIDIHPGARIGKAFFIDHGNGVVIGETAVIEDHVTMYQGVSLGARNFPHDQRGNLIRGAQRHPTIRFGTVMYANASVLGNIEIGHKTTIGANVSLRESVKPESRVRLDPAVRRLLVTQRTETHGEHSSSPPSPTNDQLGSDSLSDDGCPWHRDVNLIRPSASEDIPVIAEQLRLLALEAQNKHLSLDDLERRLHCALGRPELCRCFVAEVDGRVAAHMMLLHELSPDSTGVIWRIQSVYVEQALRRRDVCRLLFRHVESLAKTTPDVYELRLFVENRDSIAATVYTKLGMIRRNDWLVLPTN